MGSAHRHHHGADHGAGRHQGASPVSRLGAAAAINVGFAVVQVVVGIAIGAVVVLADALHQVVDAVGLVTALIAVNLARRGPGRTMSFGWGKADALGAYTSGLLLMGSIVWIAAEAIDRLRNPVEVGGVGVIVIGLCGIAVNGGSVVLLGHGDHLALRAARLHLLIDLAGSVVVVATGVVLVGSSVAWIDPVSSLLVTALVLRSTVSLLRTAAGELLDRSPHGIGPDDVARALLGHPGVVDVHHVHSRPLGPGVVSVTAHVVVAGDLSLHDAQGELDVLQGLLADRLGIDHATLQLECHECGQPVHVD